VSAPSPASRTALATAALAWICALSFSSATMRAPAPVAYAVSALVNLGYAQIQASAAVAAAVREAGEGADTAKLIRLGLKELAR